MLASVASATLSGAVGRAVSVEVHVSNGLPGFTIVGLPDAAVREARDRVRAAILSSGLPWPMRRITANLAPAAVEIGNHDAARDNGVRGTSPEPVYWGRWAGCQDSLLSSSELAICQPTTLTRAT